MTYTRIHDDWRDFPDTTTPVMGADLEHMEDALVDAVYKGELVINVRDHGAVGDGSTDDSAAIQAAIDAAIAQTSGGGSARVYIPAGTYKIVTGLVIAGSWITVFGDGRDRTILMYYGAAAGSKAVRVDEGAVRRFLSITDMTIQTHSSAGTGAICLYLYNCYKGTFRRLRLIGSAAESVGLSMYGLITTSTYYNVFYDLDATASFACIMVDGSVTRGRFYNGVLAGTGRAVYMPGTLSGETCGTFNFTNVSMSNSCTDVDYEMIRLGWSAADPVPSVGNVRDVQFQNCSLEAGTATDTYFVASEVSQGHAFNGGTWSGEIQFTTDNGDDITLFQPKVPRFRIPYDYERHDYNLEVQGRANNIRGSFIGYPIGTSDGVLTANRTLWWKLFVTHRFTFDQAVIRVVTSSGNVDAGLFASLTDGTVGAKVVSSGSVACPAAGRGVIPMADTTIEPGLYHLAFSVDNATASFGLTARASEWMRLRIKSSTFPLPADGTGQSTDIASLPAMTLELS